MISFPAGRVDEVVELPDHTFVHPILLYDVCQQGPGVLQFQVRQTAPSMIRFSLVTTPQADKEVLTRYVLERFEQRLGTAANAEVCFVQELERTSAGKTPTVIAFKRFPASPVVEEQC